MTDLNKEREALKHLAVSGAPERIFLTYGEIERDCTHAEAMQHDAVHWSEDCIESSDVEYIRADIAHSQSSAPAWIAVESELPPANVLVLTNNGSWMDIQYQESGAFEGDGMQGLKVKHWMPLPEPPCHQPQEPARGNEQ